MEVHETLTRSLQLTPDHRLTAESLDGEAFASLCFSAGAAARPRLLRIAAARPDLSPYLKLTMFLGFCRDPRPCVRRAALDGIASVGEGDAAAITAGEMIGGCYFAAAELLRDGDDGVRSAAVRSVCAWGLIRSASNPEMKAQYSDEIFVKLCSMARDMNMKVRVETFFALGKIEMVSEDILLQTLSKRVLGIIKEKRSLGRCCGKQFEVVVASAAGALLHGLEDEFHEVRKSVCCTLSKLILLSAKFAVEALELLMDILNDDSVIVRLQALYTMLTMAACDRLKLQVKHMHMFLGPLVDKNTSVREAARKILKLVKLSVLELFKLTVDALLQNLARYPEDEVDVFSVLFRIGRNHGKYVICRIEDIYQQIEPTFEGKLDFDNPRVAALIVLAISAPLLGENMCTIPPTIYSYAVTVLGRISNALSDVIDQSSLLVYLSQCSRSTRVTEEFKEMKFSDDDMADSGAMSLQKTIHAISEAQFQEMKAYREVSTSVLKYKVEIHDEVTKSMNCILATVKDTWPLVQSGNIHDVLRILRNCKEELSTFNSNSTESSGVVAFTYQYIQILKLLSKVWDHFRPSKFSARRMGTLDLLFGKLERRLRELRTRFIGLSYSEELHVSELVLLTYTLRLSNIEICCRIPNLRRLTSTISWVESLIKEGSIEPSEFVIELGKSSPEIRKSINGNSCALSPFKRFAELFSLRQFVFDGGLKRTEAELNIPENDFGNPIFFVPGLPVGISCSITLVNVSVENKLWLRMTIDNDVSAQFIFLDLSRFEDCGGGLRKLNLVAPFYRTPKASSLSIKLCICMECRFEDLRFDKGRYGPKHEVAYLCKEREVFLALRNETTSYLP